MANVIRTAYDPSAIKAGLAEIRKEVTATSSAWKKAAAEMAEADRAVLFEEQMLASVEKERARLAATSTAGGRGGGGGAAGGAAGASGGGAGGLQASRVGALLGGVSGPLGAGAVGALGNQALGLAGQAAGAGGALAAGAGTLGAAGVGGAALLALAQWQRYSREGIQEASARAEQHAEIIKGMDKDFSGLAQHGYAAWHFITDSVHDLGRALGVVGVDTNALDDQLAKMNARAEQAKVKAEQAREAAVGAAAGGSQTQERQAALQAESQLAELRDQQTAPLVRQQALRAEIERLGKIIPKDDAEALQIVEKITAASQRLVSATQQRVALQGVSFQNQKAAADEAAAAETAQQNRFASVAQLRQQAAADERAYNTLLDAQTATVVDAERHLQRQAAYRAAIRQQAEQTREIEEGLRAAAVQQRDAFDRMQMSVSQIGEAMARERAILADETASVQARVDATGRLNALQQRQLELTGQINAATEQVRTAHVTIQQQREIGNATLTQTRGLINESLRTLQNQNATARQRADAQTQLNMALQRQGELEQQNVERLRTEHQQAADLLTTAEQSRILGQRRVNELRMAEERLADRRTDLDALRAEREQRAHQRRMTELQREIERATNRADVQNQFNQQQAQRFGQLAQQGPGAFMPQLDAQQMRRLQAQAAFGGGGLQQMQQQAMQQWQQAQQLAMTPEQRLIRNLDPEQVQRQAERNIRARIEQDRQAAVAGGADEDAAGREARRRTNREISQAREQGPGGQDLAQAQQDLANQAADQWRRTGALDDQQLAAMRRAIEVATQLDQNQRDAQGEWERINAQLDALGINARQRAQAAGQRQ